MNRAVTKASWEAFQAQGRKQPAWESNHVDCKLNRLEQSSKRGTACHWGLPLVTTEDYAIGGHAELNSGQTWGVAGVWALTPPLSLATATFKFAKVAGTCFQKFA